MGNTEIRGTHKLSVPDSNKQPCGRKPSSVLAPVNLRPSNSYVFTHYTPHKIK